MGTLTGLFDRHTGVHKSILIKTEALRLGIRYSEKAFSASRRKEPVTKGQSVFSQSFTAEGWNDPPPEDYYLRDGTVIQTRINGNSPYFIDYVEAEDRFFLCEKNESVTEVFFRKAPDAYFKKTSNGTSISSLFNLQGDMLNCCVLMSCQMWNIKGQCKFCDINAHAEAQRKASHGTGREFMMIRPPEQVAEAVGIYVRDPPVRHILITGGCILMGYENKDDTQFYLEYIRAIKDQIGAWYPTCLQTIAKTESDIIRIADTGVSCHSANIEVWDSKLFKWLCPGKDKIVGRNEWIKRVVSSTKHFPKGGVNPNFVIGAEMARPYGFKTVKEALRSTLGGFEYLMSNGVVPRMDFWAIEPGSELCKVDRQEAPPTEYFIEVERGWLQLLKTYGLPPPLAMCHGCSPIDTEFDWYRFH